MIQRLIHLYQLTKGTKLIETVAVSDDEDSDDAYFLYLEFSGIIDYDINDVFEFFINLIESDAPEQTLMSYDYICEHQQNDDKLLTIQVKYLNNYI